MTKKISSAHKSPRSRGDEGATDMFGATEKDFKVSGWCGKRPKCVSVAIVQRGVVVRDTKNLKRKPLGFTHNEWDAFIKGVKAGEFDALVQH